MAVQARNAELGFPPSVYTFAQNQQHLKQINSYDRYWKTRLVKVLELSALVSTCFVSDRDFRPTADKIFGTVPVHGASDLTLKLKTSSLV